MGTTFFGSNKVAVMDSRERRHILQSQAVMSRRDKELYSSRSLAVLVEAVDGGVPFLQSVKAWNSPM
jgi:hypothetical protein